MSEELQNNPNELPIKLQEEIEEVVRSKKLNKDEKRKLEENVRSQYHKSRFEPGETVGILAAQSISEPATQMSLDGKEKIISRYKDVIGIQEIEQFVDRIIERLGSIKENGWDIADISDMEIYVPSINKNEKIEWKKVLFCSRHRTPEKLLEIKTYSGRKIIATDSHSFIIRKNNEIVSVSGKILQKGDRIPVLKRLPENCIDTLNIKPIVGEAFFRAKKKLPENLPLNENTGWIFGAYISEGNCTPNFVSISSVDNIFLEKTRNTASSFNLNYNEYDNFRGFARGHDIHINSTLLSIILTKTCGNGSRNKKIPNFAYSANENFVKGLLQGYFEGDGNISVERGSIRASSNSKELIDGLALLLSRFGIFSYKGAKKQFTLTIPAKYAKVFREKIGFVTRKNSEKLDKLCEIVTKQDYVEMIGGFGDLFLKTARKLGYSTRYVNSFTRRQKIGKETLLKWIIVFDNQAKEKKVDIKDEMKIMKIMYASDVVWDEIVDSKYIKSSSDYVYDLTVEGTETFTTFEGIVTHNTMRTYHFAGSAGIRVTYGLPRLIEIFDAKKEPETPVMTIFLKREFNSRDTARKIAEEIVEKSIADVTEKVSLNLSENSIEIEPDDLKRMPTILKVVKENVKDVNVKGRTKSVVITPKGEIDIKELQKMKVKILELKVDGVEGILNAVVRKEDEDWIINTIGSNLEHVFQMKEVDEDKTITNDIHEVMKFLGIEAARNLIISEALKTMQEQGLDVDVRHVMLVGDIMTFDGGVKSIGRYGVAGAQTSVLARAAFEETIKHLVRASIRNETDNFHGIFENVMVGQVIPSGTGMFDLVAKFEEEEKRE